MGLYSNSQKEYLISQVISNKLTTLKLREGPSNGIQVVNKIKQCLQGVIHSKIFTEGITLRLPLGFEQRLLVMPIFPTFSAPGATLHPLYYLKGNPSQNEDC